MVKIIDIIIIIVWSVRNIITFILIPTRVVQVIKSLIFYKKIRESKKSDVAVIVSGYKSSDVIIDIKENNYDLYTNSSGYLSLKRNKVDNYILHFQAPFHEPLLKESYKKRLNIINELYSPEFLIGSFQNNMPLLFPQSYLLFKSWPFLKPYNGPAFLIWLTYKLGYKKIYLFGIEGTQICGSVLGSSSQGNIYSTNIKDIMQMSSLMLFEYNKIFDILFSNNIEVHQASKSSWIQPIKENRIVTNIDDSWSKKVD